LLLETDICCVLQGNPRSSAILAVAKANNVELEVVETEPQKGLSAEYLKLNKLGKVPTFVGADGYTLHEAIAIAIYSTWKSQTCCHHNQDLTLCYDEKKSFSYPCLNHPC
jgi:elongation factor 1-gamma